MMQTAISRHGLQLTVLALAFTALALFPHAATAQSDLMTREEALSTLIFIDANKDGRITPQEYLAADQIAGGVLTEAEILQGFLMFDDDGDGILTYDQFMALYYTDVSEPANEEDLAIIALFDSNNDELISPAEFVEMAVLLGEEVTLEVAKVGFAMFDSDGDEKLTYAEFIELINSGDSSEASEPTTEQWSRIFYASDTDFNGGLDVDELIKLSDDVGMASTRSEWEVAVLLADNNNDGLINLDEFLIYMME